MRDVDEFSAHRDHLMAVAYRMLGSRADAEDAVQEAWLRYAASTEDIDDLRAWLTTVTARICLDVLRSARVRREAYVGPWLPEPTISRLDSTDPFGVDPGERAARIDELGYALLVVLERLSPEQRVALVLHDVFAVPFDSVAQVLGTSTESARQLASRARRAVTDGAPRHHSDTAEQQRVLTAFLHAAEDGDIQGLLEVLAPDVVSIGDGGGVAPAGRVPVVGALKVARFMAGLFRRTQEAMPMVVERVLVNGNLGLIIEVDYPGHGKIRAVAALAIADGRITAIYNQLNPAKVAHVPEPDPARNALG